MEIHLGGPSYHHDHHDHHHHHHHRVTTTMHVSSPKALIGFGIFTILFVAALTVAYLFLSKTIGANSYVETQAVIVENYSYFDSSSGNYMYSAIAEFEVDGKTYLVKENKSSNVAKLVGAPVTVKYNPENPQEAEFKSDGFTIIIVIIVDVVFALAGIAMIASGIKKLKNGESLSGGIEESYERYRDQNKI